jgi:protein ImuA
MSLPDRQQRLAALRDTIADIERKPVLADRHTMLAAEPGEGFPRLANGLLQEIFTDERRNSGAALGFALAQARSLLSEKRLAVIYLQLSKHAQEMGLPYGPGLASFGFDPASLILVRPANMVELLWAAEEALACKAVAAVIADIPDHPKILDFTASRRLSLRAASSGTAMVLLRYGQWREASAAPLRWHLSAALSGETPFDAKAPGEARWRITLEKGVLAETRQQQWLLGWTEHGFHIIAPPANAARVHHPAAAISGALPADLADRFRQTA